MYAVERRGRGTCATVTAAVTDRTVACPEPLKQPTTASGDLSDCDHNEAQRRSWL